MCLRVGEVGEQALRGDKQLAGCVLKRLGDRRVVGCVNGMVGNVVTWVGDPSHGGPHDVNDGGQVQPNVAGALAGKRESAWHEAAGHVDELPHAS